MKKYSLISTAVAILFAGLPLSSMAMTEPVISAAKTAAGGVFINYAEYQRAVANLRAGNKPDSIYYKNPEVFDDQVSTSNTGLMTPRQITRLVRAQSVGPAWIPATAPIDIGYQGNGFFIESAVVEDVKYLRSPVIAAPGTISVNSCKNGGTSLSTESRLATTAGTTISGATTSEYITENSSKIGVGVEAEFTAIPEQLKFKGNFSVDIGKSEAQKRGTTLTDSWTNLTVRTDRFSVTADKLVAGTRNQPSITTPMVEIYGYFNLGRMFKQGGDGYNRRVYGKALYRTTPTGVTEQYFDESKVGFELYQGSAMYADNRSNADGWRGKIIVPASFLSIGNQRGQDWFVDQDIMTAGWYQRVCAVDWATGDIAEVMKPQLCKLKNPNGTLKFAAACKKV
jgi:hypothetical protein